MGYTATKKFLLLDFPAELVQKILFHMVIARGVKRALRLRLVCKLFSYEIQPALFESRLLDKFDTSKILADWYTQNDHGASKLWHSYLAYRVHIGTSPSQPRFLAIRQVAERVRAETGADLELTISSLCWPALLPGTASGTDSVLAKQPVDQELDLLCAAAYLHLVPLARRLIQEKVSPTAESQLFSSPMRLAAWAGNSQILEMFQEHLPELEGIDPNRVNDPCSRWKVGPASMEGAAIRGDMEMVRLAVYPPSRVNPNFTDLTGQIYGNANGSRHMGNALFQAQYATKNFEVYRYFDKFLAMPTKDHFTWTLTRYASRGNLEMVRYALDAGADIRGSSGREGNPLSIACRRCHKDVVDLLLERGADPNFEGDEGITQGETAIIMAACGGSLDIVRKLVDHGADLRRERMGMEVCFIALCRAVAIEHTEMVKFFLGSGIDLDIYGEALLKTALDRGLDSMAEIFRREGPTLGS
ncbi:Ankyrin repeat domain-containing protein [Lachnellula suecica]|uniref:Ankyrin repeat domain-containing protein n=1 Tax=Lachnellula suecica TaxID=602035 RepID=A0A8T9CJ06_9HELO|nr:Ankyrin repeat domain-containing protein [Lachnellula suecica]